MSHLLECDDRSIRERVMLASRVDLAYVNLPQPGAEFAQDHVCLGHGRVALARVSDVETERRIWNLAEDLLQLFGCSSNRLAPIHVLDAKERSEFAPRT